MPKPFRWTPDNVSALDPAARSIKTYIEQRDLRHILDIISDQCESHLTCAEVGAGFGRMTVLLDDYSLPGQTTAFEREPDMVAAMLRLLPSVNAVHVNALTNLPAEDGAFDLVMSFTVLQHMTDLTARGVLSEMARISRRYVLVVEDTDPEYHYVDKKTSGHFTHGRMPEWYGRYLPGFELKQSWDREVEPGFTYKGVPRPIVGAYMLFEKAASNGTI